MRDQHFTPDQFKVAAQVFGELKQHDKKETHVPGHPDVYYVSNDEVVNGKRIQTAQLESGDRLQIGRVELVALRDQD